MILMPCRLRAYRVALWAGMLTLAGGVCLCAMPPHPALDQSAPSPPALYASRFLDAAKSAGETGKTGHAYPAMEKLLGLPSVAGSMTAFEENRFFVYGEVRFSNSETGSTWYRRIIFFKPSTFIVDDEGVSRGASKPAAWQLYHRPANTSRGRSAGSPLENSPPSVETLLPEKFSQGGRICVDQRCDDSDAMNLIEIRPQGNPKRARFLHVVSFPAANRDPHSPSSQLIRQRGSLELIIRSSQHTFRWLRPETGDSPGEIDITATDAARVLGTRPLPSGIMPHTPEGARLLETWDGDYRDGKHPKWDTGQPSADLVKAIEEGVFKPGRVIEFGSGTGTDAVYMATKGFDVTTIDISPSAVAQALEKAKKAGVKVRFLLADALNPPEVGQFDYIYDRACYHEVRGQNLEAYIETLKKVSRPGTRLLLVAGNSNGPDLGFGPPTVSEEELRFDFTPLFDIEWLKESRFEVFPAEAGFPLAWSVLMKRK